MIPIGRSSIRGELRSKGGCGSVPYILLCAAAASIPSRAIAEVVVAKVGDVEVYSDGRAGAFASWSYGNGYPSDVYGVDATGNFVNTPVSSPVGGGWKVVSDQGLNTNPQLNIPAGTAVPDEGTINLWRVRSGFVSNILGFGVRSPLTARTTMSAYLQLWMFVENNGRQKNQSNYPDARQGYVKLEGPWGSFAAGRTRGIFSRGATDIDVLYAHRWGVGFPGNIDSNGPTNGQLGFGVLGVGFSSGFIYGTPSLGPLHLDVGFFDPVQLQGNGGWTRTKFLRPEAELTFDQTFGAGGWGRLVLFADGVYQKVYKDGYCAPVFDSVTNRNLPCDATVAGASGGGRLELGPVHIGAAAYYGVGLGLNYALEVSDAAQDREGNLRKEAGYYLQTQVVLGKFDLFAGAGIAQIFLTDYDQNYKVQDPRNPNDPNATVFPYNVIKDQIGYNAGVVYNVTPRLHVDLDFFRAEADWFAANGLAAPKQVVWVSNGGMTANW